MRTRLYCHLVWTTLNREPTIDSGYAEFLCRFLRRIAWRERAQVLAIGVVRTHVHVLVEMHPTASVSAVVKRLKGASSSVARREGIGGSGRLLRWAKGYTAHSVGPGQLEVVRRYLALQGTHHPEEAIVGWRGDLPGSGDSTSESPPFLAPASE